MLLPTNTKSSNSFLNMTHFLSLNINMFKFLNKIQIYRICRLSLSILFVFHTAS